MSLEGAALLHTAPERAQAGGRPLRAALHRHDDQRPDEPLHRARSSATTAPARSWARAASCRRRSDRSPSTAASTSRSSAAPRRSRPRRSRRSSRSSGRTSCPSACGASAWRTSARSSWPWTRTARASTRTSRSRPAGGIDESLYGEAVVMEEFLGLPMPPAQAARTGLDARHRQGPDAGRGERPDRLAGDYVDIVKLGWGTSYVAGNLGEKLRLYQRRGHPRHVPAARCSRRPSPATAWTSSGAGRPTTGSRTSRCPTAPSSSSVTASSS